ncbi:MAG: hypothetical protein M3P43_13805 [Actinomycetota bacterium]|nr:hypothetical protein [Actinomycetota bacterium]
MEAWEGRRLQLDGQEFLRFRGLWLREDVPPLVEEWGCLGIDRAAARSEARGKQGWTELLVDYPARPGAMYSELFADWIRLSGLMDYAVGVLGLLQDHAAIGNLLDALRTPAGSRPRDPEQIRADYRDEGWLRGILGGAARMNMSCEFEAGTNSMTLVSRDPSKPDGQLGFTAMLDLRLTPDGIADTLAGLVNDWLPPLHPYLVSDGGTFRLAYRPPSDLLSTLWMQFANVLSEEGTLKVCSFDGCPGPPARPHLFLWRYGSGATSSTNSTSKYCHPLCASAASTARRRAGARRDAETRDQPAEARIGIADAGEPERDEERPAEGRSA